MLFNLKPTHSIITIFMTTLINWLMNSHRRQIQKEMNRKIRIFYHTSTIVLLTSALLPAKCLMLQNTILSLLLYISCSLWLSKYVCKHILNTPLATAQWDIQQEAIIITQRSNNMPSSSLNFKHSRTVVKMVILLLTNCFPYHQ